MAGRIREEDLQAIEEVVRRRPDGMTAREVGAALEHAPPHRTLQYRLRFLVRRKRLVMQGSGRGARYHEPAIATVAMEATAGGLTVGFEVTVVLPLSKASTEIRSHVRRPLAARELVGYDRAFLENYRPNETFYLSRAERDRLHEAGANRTTDQPAGTHARHILNRLLIDLSWNSSRLEGNTYSLLDTARLIEAGMHADGKNRRDAQMILNHKDAIEFLVDDAANIGFDRYTVLNLHAALADNLLPDPVAAGRLRYLGVGIEGSVFHPLAVPQLIEECFDRILAKAAAIEDPLEQAFFAMVQLPYLQPFDDVNKRVSRLAANIPLIKSNLAPLSFEDVPRDLYVEAMLGVYELNRVELLRDVFVWAYERSASRYSLMRLSLGEPDPFRMRYREGLRALVGDVVRERMGKTQAGSHVAAWAEEHVDEAERGRFREVAERELLGLHEGNFARYRIAPSEFAAWQRAWKQ